MWVSALGQALTYQADKRVFGEGVAERPELPSIALPVHLSEDHRAHVVVGRVVIQADRSVPTSLLLQVLDTCRQAGARQLDVSAVQR